MMADQAMKPTQLGEEKETGDPLFAVVRAVDSYDKDFRHLFPLNSQ